MRWGFTRMFSGGQQTVDPLFERRDDYDLWAGLGRRLLDCLTGSLIHLNSLAWIRVNYSITKRRSSRRA